MNFDYLIRVYRYFSDNRECVKVGTAYPVAPSLILTARHVLAEKGSEIDLGLIELTWFYKHNQDGKKFRSDPDNLEICWDGLKHGGEGNDWDAVVLKCNFPDGISVTPNLLSRTVPQANKTWESRGFPAIGRRNEDLRPSSLQGKTYACHPIDRIFQVDEQAKSKDAEGWCGASGAPVFVNNKIQGLLIEACKLTKGARLDALPMHQLLSLQSFREAVGLPKFQAFIDSDRFKGRIISILKQNSKVLKLLEDIAQKHKDFNGKPICMPCGCDSVLDRSQNLVEHMFKEFYCAKRLIEHALHECDVQKNSDYEDIVLQIAYLYFPACFEPEESELILAEYEDDDVTLLDGRAASVASIEVRMAAMEGRSVNFDLDQTREDGPVGRNKIHEPPAFPLEADWSEEFTETFAKMLHEKTFSAVRYKIKKYSSLSKRINEQLKIGASPEGVPYLVFGDPGDEKNKKLTDAECQQMAATIKNQFDNLAIFSVSGADEVIERELEYLDWFWKKFSKS